MTTPGQITALQADGKPVILVTSSIHSTEVGGILTPMVLAQKLVGDDDQNARQISGGPRGKYPDSLKGGLGDAGAKQLAAFVDAGGAVVAFNSASNHAIEALALPVKNVLAEVRPNDFYAPGSLFRVEFDRAQPACRWINCTACCGVVREWTGISSN